MEGVNLEHLEAARFFLFGDVKFLHLLLLLMALDVIAGVAKAIKNKNLWSRKSLFGYARKLLVLVVIILANVVDQILGLNGAVTYATVLFYIVNEGLSIIENLAAVGVLVPTSLAEKLKGINSSGDSFVDEVRDELTSENVEDELKDNKK
ncbi:holin [Virgibacillus phage Mimir87]|nr:holin [Virgibacillus phage Mimir87]